ncbi:asparagine synthase [Novosphingobium indicum]|uniref:asparagine synthase (glutamine-hydrolyzing) n=1 Tax=Novosphingobium indicum TaxID=462949 RepID=A0ABQ2JW63_9SPHN|nr:asparagine synthase C-terminal domain-containing protein [Novosphingobium indicum]GGN57310.1 asparagine synthase [Novosphingobium indicum]
MAPRYILFHSPDADEREGAASRAAQRCGLTMVAVPGPFSLVVSDESDVLPIPGGGAVIGTIFHRHGPPEAIRDLDQRCAEAIRKSNGAHLIERYWGGYLAAFEMPGGACVLRAPQGALPCFQLRQGGLHIFASDPGLLLKAGLLAPRIDWDELQRHLFVRDLPSPRTAIAGLCELLPGTCASLAEDGEGVSQCWSPWDYAATLDVMEPEECAERLGRALQQCISAWGSRYANILLSVSGGLDSSIVATTLADRGLSFSCLTLATRDPSGDERSYARIIAAHCHARLHECGYSLDAIDLDRSVVAHLPRPCGRTHDLAFRAVVTATAAEQGADAYFTGNGGDNVFYNSASARPIADRYLAEGIGPGLVRTLRDVCAVTGAGAWQAMREARRVLKRSGKGYVWRTDPLFLHSDIAAHDSRQPAEHPWLEAPREAFPGKAGHVAMLLRMQQHLDGCDRALPFTLVNPLVSQPIVETCLAIPSWAMCAGGINRAVARDAYVSRLPPQILERRSKAGPDSFIVELLTSRLGEIRERLLGGRLASQGLLDLDALGACLGESRLHTASEYMRIMALLDTEAWIGHWS